MNARIKLLLKFVLAIALFALGSVFGTPLGGLLVSRFAARNVLPTALVGSAITLSAVGSATQSIALVVMLLGFAGFFLGVASSGLTTTPLARSRRWAG